MERINMLIGCTLSPTGIPTFTIVPTVNGPRQSNPKILLNLAVPKRLKRKTFYHAEVVTRTDSPVVTLSIRRRKR